MGPIVNPVQCWWIRRSSSCDRRGWSASSDDDVAAIAPLGLGDIACQLGDAASTAVDQHLLTLSSVTMLETVVRSVIDCRNICRAQRPVVNDCVTLAGPEPATAGRGCGLADTVIDSGVLGVEGRFCVTDH